MSIRKCKLGHVMDVNNTYLNKARPGKLYLRCAKCTKDAEKTRYYKKKRQREREERKHGA